MTTAAQPEVVVSRRSRRLTEFLRQTAFAEERLFLILAIYIGVISGFAVVCFRVVIDWSRIELLGSAVNPARERALIVPAAAGLVVAVLVIWVFPRVRGSGVNQTKAALYIYKIGRAHV